MPTKSALQKSRSAARSGKQPSTQAGPFIEEEMRRYKRGSRTVRSREQAIAIGLSEARRAGVDLRTPEKGSVSPSTRRKAARDKAIGQGRAKSSPARSRGARKAARTRQRKAAEK
jgi:hypothetical protein